MKILSKTIAYVIVASSLFLAVSANAAPGDPIIPLIHPGNATQPITSLGIGLIQGANSGSQLSVLNGTRAVSSFPKPGSLFVVLQNFISAGTTWIGDRDTGFSQDSGIQGNINFTTQELNVEGKILSTTLQNGGSNKSLCVTAGVIEPCTTQ